MPQTCGNLRHGSPKNLYVCFKWMQNPHVFLNKAGLLTHELANVEPTGFFYLSLGPFDKVFSSDVS